MPSSSRPLDRIARRRARIMRLLEEAADQGGAPTVEDLAAASVEEVLSQWSGLGYYRRARLLHQAARKIVDSGEGFPNDLEGLKSLPGVGDYTAAAVGSIAFGLVEPAVDGNIEAEDVVRRRSGHGPSARKGWLPLLPRLRRIVIACRRPLPAA